MLKQSEKETCLLGYKLRESSKGNVNCQCKFCYYLLGYL